MSGGRGTALITGASSGFGEGFAHECAQRGYNVILVARRADRLKALADALTGEYGIVAEALTADLTVSEDIERVENRIHATPDFSLLINNAGFNVPIRFYHLKPETATGFTRLNVETPVRLTRAALPGMIERGQGGIINVSTFATMIPPFRGNVMYYSTRRFLVDFTRNLALEVRDKGIDVLAICPGFSQTEIFKNDNFDKWDYESIPWFMWTPIETMVSESLDMLPKRKVVFVPGRNYRLLRFIVSLPVIRQLLTVYLRRI